jgi:restriction system protein
MSTRKYKNVPTVDELYVPVLKALKALGGSANIEELNQKVYEIMKLPESVLSIPHNDDGRSKIEYRLAWARTRLKLAGYLENSSRAVWTLVNQKLDVESITNDRILKELKAKTSTNNEDYKINFKVDLPSIEDAFEEVFLDWKSKLLKSLYEISPAAFERLTQRILRESGFTQVEVLGKSGDGGIDGKGIVRLSVFLSFHVIFQCKRYKGTVSSSQIRDFRGAMQGRADKGLFITTGTFSRDASKEATRDGAPPIDLIDGELLCEKLKELKLGVKIELIENITIDEEWYKKL